MGLTVCATGQLVRRLTVGHYSNCAVYRLYTGHTVSAIGQQVERLNFGHYNKSAGYRLYFGDLCHCNKTTGRTD